MHRMDCTQQLRGNVDVKAMPVQARRLSTQATARWRDAFLSTYLLCPKHWHARTPALTHGVCTRRIVIMSLRVRGRLRANEGERNGGSKSPVMR